jgi:hypothetical protein
MINKTMKIENWNKFLALIVILSILTGLFWGYQFQRKNIQNIEMGYLKNEIVSFKQQINAIQSQISAPQHDSKYLKTFQIYNLIEEGAYNSQMALKSFSNDKKNNNIEVTLIGNYPNAIVFFKFLRQAKFNLIRKIEFKNNSQDPQKSIVIQLKIYVPTAKGAKKF